MLGLGGVCRGGAAPIGSHFTLCRMGVVFSVEFVLLVYSLNSLGGGSVCFEEGSIAAPVGGSRMSRRADIRTGYETSRYVV